MDKTEKQILESQIKEQIAKTETSITSYRKMTQPIGPENSIGRVSRMEAINNKSVMESALRTAENKLDKLQRALSRIDRDSFGLCIDCGRPIAVKRLLYTRDVLDWPIRCAPLGSLRDKKKW